MKKILIFCLFMLGFFSVMAQRLGNDQATIREYEIAVIRVSGSKFLDPGALISLSGLRQGDKIKIPGMELSDAIRKLWKQGIVGDIQILIDKFENEKVFLNIQLTERPKISRFFFAGDVRKGEQQTLGDKVGFLKGTISTPARLKKVQRTIEKYYVDKGFLNCNANIVQIKDSIISNSVYLKINVNKGKRVKIRPLNIDGNVAYSDKRVARKLKGTKQKKATRIFTASKFVRAKYEEDKENLIKFYNSEGYRDARVIGDTIYPIDKKHIGLNLKIEEGNRYYFRNITWKGNYVYDSPALSRVLGVKKGDVYDVENLEKRLNFSQTDLDITSLYMDDGYLFFRVEPVEIAIVGDSVDIEMQIYEGPQANINRIILNGNTKTSDKVVLREIRTMPGQKFSRSDLIRSQREISTLGYFDPEKIGINPIPNPEDGTVDIEYTVEEKPSDQIELSGGWGGAFGFVGTLGVVFNNFSARKIFKFGQWGGVLPSGDGQRLSLRLQANGRQFQTYSMTFTEPWLGGRKPNSFSINLSHSVQRRIDFSGNSLGYLKLYTASLTLGRRLQWPDNFFTISNSLSYTHYDIQNFDFSIFSSGSGRSNSVAFNTTISRNSIDNPTFPRRGSSMSLSVSLTPPYSLFQPNRKFAEETDLEKFRWVEYHKWMIDNSWFTELFGKFVLNTRAHFGYLGAYNQRLGVGPFERFVLGGAGLTGQNFGFLLGLEIIGLRGYADNSVAPPRNLAAGGVVYNKYVMELRYPVSLNPAATIFVLGFMEAGNNWLNYSEYNPFNLKRSAGFGARIFMPAFGMIGLDWAYGFDRVPGAPADSNGSRFHFTIGQQFR
ncbi:MAG: outer membrane protein assembly factor BamA [Microscillaceae bacterium]|jgi:outer membrane protein insertion porin family|nr:outer membrane protein assembly factor BamA [Microscillaceae bacterium]